MREFDRLEVVLCGEQNVKIQLLSKQLLFFLLSFVWKIMYFSISFFLFFFSPCVTDIVITGPVTASLSVVQPF